MSTDQSHLIIYEKQEASILFKNTQQQHPGSPAPPRASDARQFQEPDDLLLTYSPLLSKLDLGTIRVCGWLYAPSAAVRYLFILRLQAELE